MGAKGMPRALGAFGGARARAAETSALNRTIEDQAKQIAHLEQLLGELIAQTQGSSLLPPSELRLHVGARTSAANFWRQGRDSSRRVLEVFGREPDGQILDWGCGSGRTLQWLLAEPGWRAAYRGCDVDRRAVSWLRKHGFEGVKICNDDPPLPYPDGAFAGLFCFSVLTHIHPERHGAWLREIRRVLRVGSKAYLTFGGPSRLDEASAPVETRRAFEANGWCFIEHEGHYKSAALVSRAFMLERLEGLFAVESYRERGYHQMDELIVRAI
jgi:SAM-dependent methyltransferase